MEKHWYKQSYESVPHSLKSFPEQRLPDVVQDGSSQPESYTPLLFKAETVSYAEMEKLSKFFKIAR